MKASILFVNVELYEVYSDVFGKGYISIVVLAGLTYKIYYVQHHTSN